MVRIEFSSVVKATILTTSRAVNWCVIYGQIRYNATADTAADTQGWRMFKSHVVWMPAVGMFLSHLLCLLFMRTEKSRRSRCPPIVVALSQIGALLELSPRPLCPGCEKTPERTAIAVELVERSEANSFISSFSFPPNNVSYAVDAASLSDPEDLNKLRARVLRKICVAAVPESVCCIVVALDRLTAEIHHLEPLWPPVDPPLVVAISGTLATGIVAWGLADIIISMWIKTDFVQDNARLVQFFYLVEICSWWPFLFQIAEEGNVLVMVQYLSSELVVMILLVVIGFYAIPGSSKFRGSLLNIALHFIGQVALAATLSPFLAGANLLFFDNSLTFKFLNRMYYPVRYLHVAWYITRLPKSVHLEQMILDPLNCCALACLFIQILLVYVVVPWRRKASLRQSAEDFQHQTGGTMEAQGAKIVGEKRDSQPKVPSASTSLRASIFVQEGRSKEDSFIEVLNALGDTFEALLLAGQAHSPRVRCAVLGVAILPLSKARPAMLLQLLPLILPQLLLALRWRTVEDIEDCPLSCFLIEKALSLDNINFASIVYWQLLGLAADRSDKAWPMYQEVRIRFLYALMRSEYNGRQYNKEFCEKAVAQIANQRRLSFQVRMVSKAVAAASGGHTARCAALRKQLSILQERKERRAEQALRQADEEVGTTDVGRASVASTDPTQEEESSPRSMETLEEPAKTRKQVLFAEDVADCGPGSPPRERIPSGSLGGSASDLSRRASQEESREVESRRCCACCFRKSNLTKEDAILEEWKADPSMQQYGNQELTVLDAGGTPLPVEPTLPLGVLESKRCFVANSAVAPVVFAYEDTNSRGATEARQLHLYAMKKGDDLRQDAFVLQIFRIMETTWAEHGLQEVALMPYNALALSPKEGMAAFVPRSKNVATILQEFDGGICQFLKKHCATSSSIASAYDRLCGSTAGYCVATYLLGIGDRHLDNIMITQEGHFFHIDFGFVLGDDPKPLAPSVRVPREVLDVLRQTGRYERFRDLMREAFTLVRRTARLWTALLALPASAGGNGVTPLRDHADRAIHTVRQRLHLELDDTAAAAELTAEVEQNASAMLPIIYDKLHQAGLFWH